MRRTMAVIAGAVLGLVLAPGLAAAHDPIIVTPDQATPDQGPAFPDGTISFAIYGTLEVPGSTAGMRVTFAEGDQLDLSLLVPDQAPENEYADDQLPTLLVQAPDGSERTLTPATRVPFAEEFSGTNYLRYIELSEPAQAGEYRLTVTAANPARFTLSFGTRETFGTPVENVVDRAAASDGIQTWYRTPPSSTAPVLIAPAPTDSEAPLVIAPAPTETVTTEGETAKPTTGGTLAVTLGALLGLALIVWLARSVMRRAAAQREAAEQADGDQSNPDQSDAE